MTKEDLIKLVEKLPDGCEVEIETRWYDGEELLHDYHTPVLFIHDNLKYAFLSVSSDKDYFTDINDLVP